MLRLRLIETEKFLGCRDRDSSRLGNLLDVETETHRDWEICWMSRPRPVETGPKMSIPRLHRDSRSSLVFKLRLRASIGREQMEQLSSCREYIRKIEALKHVIKSKLYLYIRLNHICVRNKAIITHCVCRSVNYG